MSDQARIGVLISGRGSNMIAIADSIIAGQIPNAKIAVVISNKSKVPGIRSAQRLGLRTETCSTSPDRTRENQEREVLAILKAFDVDLVCLAGYMRLLSTEFVAQYPGRILNIHPALLPSFPGHYPHRDTLAHGVKVSGCTVHIVDENCDNGPIVVQRTVPVFDSDDEDALSERILHEEHIAYTEAINKVLSGDYEVVGRRFLRVIQPF